MYLRSLRPRARLRAATPTDRARGSLRLIRRMANGCCAFLSRAADVRWALAVGRRVDRRSEGESVEARKVGRDQLDPIDARRKAKRRTRPLSVKLDAISGMIDVALATPLHHRHDQPRISRRWRASGRTGLPRYGADGRDRLDPGGKLILYTGSAIVEGHDALCEAMVELDCDLRYREIDPDVFGEELALPAYATVDRIAIVAAVFTQ